MDPTPVEPRILPVDKRLSLVFPATAIDAKTSLWVAWAQTRGNGLRMMLVVGAVPWILSWATHSIYRDEAGVLEALAVAGVATLFVAIGVAAVSLSYLELIRRPRVGKDIP
jgi:hypothetical protein